MTHLDSCPVPTNTYAKQVALTVLHHRSDNPWNLKLIFPPELSGGWFPITNCQFFNRMGGKDLLDNCCGASFREHCKLERQQVWEIQKGLWRRVRWRTLIGRPWGWGGRWVSELVSQAPCHTNAATLLFSTNRLVCCEWAIASAQQEAAPPRARRVSEHLVPIKLLICLGSVTALGWFHPAHGSVSRGQLELPWSFLGPPTGHPGHQLATHCNRRASYSKVSSEAERWFLPADSTPQGPETPKQIKAFIIFAFTIKQTNKKPPFQMFVLAKKYVF